MIKGENPFILVPTDEFHVTIIILSYREMYNSGNIMAVQKPGYRANKIGEQIELLLFIIAVRIR